MMFLDTSLVCAANEGVEPSAKRVRNGILSLNVNIERDATNVNLLLTNDTLERILPTRHAGLPNTLGMKTYQVLMGPWSPLSRHELKITFSRTTLAPPRPSLKLMAARGML